MLLACAFAYIDTIELFCRTRFPIELKNALRATTGRKVWEVPMRNNRGDMLGWTLFVNQPTIDAIRILDANFTKNMSLYRVHVAYDFDPSEGVTQDQVVKLIETAFHLRYRRDSDEQHQYEDTIYAVRVAGRKSRPYRQTAFYRDRPGKLDGECDKPHFEIRLERKRPVLTAGITRPIDLLDIKPVEFFARHVTIRDHKTFLVRKTQDLIKNTIKDTPRPHVDIEKRVRALLRQMGVGTLTGFKKQFKRQFERLDEWACIDINDKLNWVRALGRGGEIAHIVTSDMQTSPIRPARRRERLRIRERLDASEITPDADRHHDGKQFALLSPPALGR
jgi:hypothetical protein